MIDFDDSTPSLPPLIIDKDRIQVTFGDRSIPFHRKPIPWKLLVEITKRPAVWLRYDHLRHEIWKGHVEWKSVRSTLSRLRKHLIAGGAEAFARTLECYDQKVRCTWPGKIEILKRPCMPPCSTHRLCLSSVKEPTHE